MQRDFYKTDLEVLKFNRIKGNTEKEFKKKLLYLTICSNENYQRRLKEFDSGVVKLTLRGLSDDLYKFSAKKYKLSKSIISTYLTELVDEGLLEVIQKGSNNNNSASLYRITTYKKARTDNGTETRTDNRTDKYSNFNGLDITNRTDTRTDIKTENWNSKKELIKRINKKELYSEIVERFNFICNRLPKVIKITDKRKKSIDSRIKEYNQETIYKVFDMVASNKFLNGDNDRGWKADFDWLLNPNNFIKVLEGKYNNQEQQIKKQPKEEPKGKVLDMKIGRD